MTDDRHAAVLDHWGIEPQTVTRASAGTMNEVLIVVSRGARVVLRGHRRAERELVEFEHDVMDRARARDIPAPGTIPTVVGERFVWHDDRWWSLFRWIDGTQPRRGDHSRDQAHSMGAMLGRIHSALRDLAPPPRPDTAEATDSVVERIEQLITHIRALPARGPDEVAALDWLHGQRTWVQGRSDDPPEDGAAQQTIHGDYHDANVLFAGPSIAGVIDWDTPGSGVAAVEVIRAMHLSFRLEVPTCRAFLAGYRSARPLRPDELHLAASLYASHRDRSVWFFDELYRQGNERLRPLINHGPFIPFEHSWAQLLRNLD